MTQSGHFRLVLVAKLDRGTRTFPFVQFNPVKIGVTVDPPASR